MGEVIPSGNGDRVFSGREPHKPNRLFRISTRIEINSMMKELLVLAMLFISMPAQAQSIEYSEKVRLFCNAGIDNGQDPCGYIYWYAMAIGACELSNAGLLTPEGKAWMKQFILSPYDMETAPPEIKEALLKTESEGCNLSN